MLDAIIGEHPALRKVRLRLPALAQSYDTVLIVGEHGVGKTLTAGHIHALSPFAQNKLMTIDCSLLDHRDQRLRLLGGSIGESSTVRRSPLEVKTTVVIKHPENLFLELQQNLVAAVARKEVVRFNESKVRPVQCRIVFILNNGPQSLYNSGKLFPGFLTLLQHSDRVVLPPLRKRGEDIFLLAKHFAQNAGRKRITGFTKSRKPSAPFARLLKNHKWPGNVAELRTFIDALVARSPEYLLQHGEVLELLQMKRMLQENKPFSLRGSLRSIHSHFVENALNKTEGNRVQAATLLGLTEASIR